MRRLPLAFLACLLALPAAADTESWVRAQRRLAETQDAAGKADEAIETLRLAVVATRRAGLRVESARCLLALAAIESDIEHDAAMASRKVPQVSAPLRRAAAAAAAEAGDVALEAHCFEALGFGADPDDAVLQADRLDTAAVAGNLAALLDIAFFEVDIVPALEFIDSGAEATLAARGGNAEGAAKSLAAALKDAEKQGWKRASAWTHLRLARLANESSQGGSDDSLRHAGDAVAAFEALHSIAGRAAARFELGRGLAAKGDTAAAKTEFEKALLEARELSDFELEGRVLQGLAGIAGPAEKPGLFALAAQAENRRHRRVLDLAAAALEGGEGSVEAAEALLAERTRRPEDAAEADRLRTALGFGDPSPRRELPAEYRKHLVAALTGEQPFATLVPLEILRRYDTWPVVAEIAVKAPSAWIFANAVETLATHEDMATLFGLLDTKEDALAEAAAAAILRLATDADFPAVKKALANKPRLSVAVYLQGVLAKSGDPAALKSLQDAITGDTPAVTLHAAVVLGRLGFAGPARCHTTLPPEVVDSRIRCRILARAPRAWGAHIMTDAIDANSGIEAARVNNIRGFPDRVNELEEENNIWSMMYRLPRTPEESRICGTGWMMRADKLLQEDPSGDALTWIADGLGVDAAGGEDRLRAHNKNPDASFALEDLEFHRLGSVAGAQTRTLIIGDASAWASVRVVAAPEIGDLVDNSIRLPFEVRYVTREGDNGSLAGKIGHISISIILSNLVPSAEIRIPGFAPIEAQVATGTDDRILVTAALPVEKEGEGLETGKLIPLEKLALGTVTLRLQLDKSRATMTFPLALLVPPRKDKPDLVAAELILEPPVPKPGEEASLTLRARNIGKAVDKGGVLSVRFSVLNPQSGDGKRTIDVRLFDSDGWRPGEWRTFEARPKVVQDWYMNKYAASWTLEMGDSRLSAKIDADDRLAEDKEDNNVCELVVPLYLPDDEAKKIAEDELLGKLADVLKKVGEAQTDGDAMIEVGVMRTILSKSHLTSPATDIACLHIRAAVEMQVQRLRVREALRKVTELAKDPAANKEKLRAIHAELVNAETSLLDTGVPVKGDTISWWRNRVQATANVAGSAGEYGELSGILTGSESHTPGTLKSVSESLNRLDGVLQLMRYARDRVNNKEADNGDPIEGMISIAGGTPGMSKLHQAMLQAEIDYVDKGFRKEAGALDALSDLISGKPGAQERLDAAVKDVGAHVQGGPFNEAARKNILLGAVKDIPVIGKIVDAIVSWK